MTLASTLYMTNICLLQIEERSDPRRDHIDISDDEDEDTVMGNNNDGLHHNPLHRHTPWRDNAPDPDDPGIEHVEWNPAPGVHLARTSFRSTGPGMRPGLRTQMTYSPHFSRASLQYLKVLQAQVDHRSVTGQPGLFPRFIARRSQLGTYFQNTSIITYITTTAHGMVRKAVEASSRQPADGLPMVLARFQTIEMAKMSRSESIPLMLLVSFY